MGVDAGHGLPAPARTGRRRHRRAGRRRRRPEQIVTHALGSCIAVCLWIRWRTSPGCCTSCCPSRRSTRARRSGSRRRSPTPAFRCCSRRRTRTGAKKARARAALVGGAEVAGGPSGTSTSASATCSLAQEAAVAERRARPRRDVGGTDARTVHVAGRRRPRAGQLRGRESQLRGARWRRMKPLNILIVDDSAMMRAMIRRVVAADATSRSARSSRPATASRRCKCSSPRDRPRCFTDINMPVMNGAGAAARDRSARELAALRARHRLDRRLGGAPRGDGGPGVAAYLEKPFQPGGDARCPHSNVTSGSSTDRRRRSPRRDRRSPSAASSPWSSRRRPTAADRSAGATPTGMRATVAFDGPFARQRSTCRDAARAGARAVPRRSSASAQEDLPSASAARPSASSPTWSAARG